MALVQTAISTAIRPSVADSVFPAAAIWNLKPLRKEAERDLRASPKRLHSVHKRNSRFKIGS